MYRINDVKDIIESEGLDYAIMDYMDLDEIEDEILREFCKEAKESLTKIKNMLELD